MRIFRTGYILNLFFFFILIYLGYHLIHGQYTIQNHLIYKFEKKMFEDFNYRLKNEINSVNKDIYALALGREDMVDEITKRQYPLPAEGEILIKLD